MHIADFSLGVLGANGVVAGDFPIAVGAGLSPQAPEIGPGGGLLLWGRGLKPGDFSRSSQQAVPGFPFPSARPWKTSWFQAPLLL